MSGKGLLSDWAKCPAGFWLARHFYLKMSGREWLGHRAKCQDPKTTPGTLLGVNFPYRMCSISSLWKNHGILEIKTFSSLEESWNLTNTPKYHQILQKKSTWKIHGIWNSAWLYFLLHRHSFLVHTCIPGKRRKTLFEILWNSILKSDWRSWEPPIDASYKDLGL